MLVTLHIFAGCLAALTVDRFIGASVELWRMRRAQQAMIHHIEAAAKNHYWHVPTDARRTN